MRLVLFREQIKNRHGKQKCMIILSGLVRDLVGHLLQEVLGQQMEQAETVSEKGEVIEEIIASKSEVDELCNVHEATLQNLQAEPQQVVPGNSINHSKAIVMLQPELRHFQNLKPIFEDIQEMFQKIQKCLQRMEYKFILLTASRAFNQAQTERNMQSTLEDKYQRLQN